MKKSMKLLAWAILLPILVMSLTGCFITNEQETSNVTYEKLLKEITETPITGGCNIKFIPKNLKILRDEYITIRDEYYKAEDEAKTRIKRRNRIICWISIVGCIIYAIVMLVIFKVCM